MTSAEIVHSLLREHITARLGANWRHLEFDR